MRIWSIVIILLLFLSACNRGRELEVVTSGRSYHVIVIPEDAPPIVREAANELQKYIERMSGALLPVVTCDKPSHEHEIVLGSCDRPGGEADGLIPDNLSVEGFVIRTIGTRLFINGGSEAGILNGVYSFLESLGCRKYTEQVTLVPMSPTLRVPQTNRIENPAFVYRELYFPGPVRDAGFRKWHKLHAREGKNAWGMFVHTFDDLVPPGEFYAPHPEYFSLLNGRRIPDGQLCLSNPQVFRLVTEGLRGRMQDNPDALYWSVSQNDTYKPCECDSCQELYRRYGGYSGAMVWFVNRVAEVFPDKVISTLAYQYTRQAPESLTPAENVNIMFCSIECNRSRPIATDPASASFRKDAEDWCRLTDHLFMWDYVVQFRNLVSPFPNLRVLQPNLQYFRDMGMDMMFQQGSGNLKSEFYELRQYLLAKLLWDPDADTEAIIDDFLNGYYGPAGRFLRQYINLMHDALESSQGGLGINGYPYDAIHTYLTPELIREYELLFDQAEEVVNHDPELLERVQIARLPLEFAIMDLSLRNIDERLTYFSVENGKRFVRQEMLTRLRTMTAAALIAGYERFWEHGNHPLEYQSSVLDFIRASMNEHSALGKTVRLLTDYSHKYPAGGPAALTDGLRGLADYHYNWLGFEGQDMTAIIDLQHPALCSSVEAGFIQDISSWVFLPLSLEVSVSDDGEHFTQVSRLQNHIPDNRPEAFIHSFQAGFVPVTARYVLIQAKNMGNCPGWHPGYGHPAWIFCDEIAVR